MESKGKQSIDFWQKFQSIKDDMSKGSLEDIKDILDHYNQGPFIVDGVSYGYTINPLEAACLNARYYELTGQNHPTFIREQGKVLDELIALKGNISINGKPNIYQRLKNNLTGNGLGIGIVTHKKSNYIDKLKEIRFDMSMASLEDVKDILDHYEQDSVLINGVEYPFRPNPLQAASLNARYFELTGQNHPIFEKVQNQILEEEVKNREGIKVNSNPTIYEQLKGNIEIGNNEHILNRASEIIQNPQEASLEDISSLLNYYNGKPVIINGVANFPFNDPISAEKLNTRYKELTGEDHPVYVEQTEKMARESIRDEQSVGYNNFLKVNKLKFAQIFDKTKGRLGEIIKRFKNRFKRIEEKITNKDNQK